MNRKVLVYSAACLAIVYGGLEKLGEKVEDVRVVDVNARDATSADINAQQFYPVLSLDNSGSAESNGNVESAFFTPPPQEDVASGDLDEPLELLTDVNVVEIPEIDKTTEPEPIDPINFLKNHSAQFNVHAAMPDQKAAIINGWAVRVGETLSITIPVSYTDRFGNEKNESIAVTLSDVSPGVVTLVGESSKGWPQRLRISI